MDREYDVYPLPDGSKLMVVPFKSRLFSLYLSVPYGLFHAKTHKEFEIAHFLEHLFATLTSKKYPDGKENQRVLNSHGIVFNASTYPYKTTYMYSGLKDGLPVVIDMMIHCYLHFSIDNKIFQQEKRAVLNELMSHMSDPYHVVYDTAHRYLHQKHDVLKDFNYPNRYKSSEALKKEDVLRVYRENYPGVSLFSVSGGGFRPATVKKAFTRLLKKSTNTRCESLQRNFTFFRAASPLKKPLVVRTKGARSTMVNVLWHVDVAWHDHQKQILLGAVNYVMAGDLLGRLFLRLRLEEGLIYSIQGDSQFSEDAADGFFGFSTLVADKNAVKKVISIIVEECEKFRPVSPKELEAMKNTMLYTFEEGMQRNKDVPEYWIQAYYTYILTGKPVPSKKEQLKRIESLSAREVTSFARSLFKPNHRLCILGEP